MTKVEKLKNAITEFDRLPEWKRTKENYLKFMVEIVGCFRQGTGLTWSQAEEILDTFVKENPRRI